MCRDGAGAAVAGSADATLELLAVAPRWREDPQIAAAEDEACYRQPQQREKAHTCSWRQGELAPGCSCLQSPACALRLLRGRRSCALRAHQALAMASSSSSASNHAKVQPTPVHLNNAAGKLACAGGSELAQWRSRRSRRQQHSAAAASACCQHYRYHRAMLRTGPDACILNKRCGLAAKPCVRKWY